MEQVGPIKKTLYSASTASLSPLVYGACISSVVILHTHIQRGHTGCVSAIYRDLNLLLFGGAFLSNIAATNMNIERTSLMRLSSLIFICGFGLFWAPSLVCLYVGRLLVGLAAGIQANVVPCYISSISPMRYRGTLTSLYGISIIGGIILGYVLALLGVCIYSTSTILAVLCVLQFVMLGRCLQVEPAAPSTDGRSAGFFAFLLSPRSWRSLIIIALFHFAQHLSGINHILLNAATIFPKNDALVTLLHLCLLALATSVASSYLSDRFGRASLTIVSCTLMISSCAAFYYAFWQKLFAVVFIIGYNVAISNIPFVLIGELFPPGAMGHGALFATSCNWLGAFLSVFVLVGDAERYNSSFLVYISYQVFLMLVVMTLYSETKGKAPGYQ